MFAAFGIIRLFDYLGYGAEPMAINKNLLYHKVKNKLINQREKTDFDLPLILYLIEKARFENQVLKV